MTCEEARWLEFESEEARAHAAGCAECGEWVADGVALRGLADEVVPKRVRRRPVGWGVAAGAVAAGAGAAAMVLWAVVADKEVARPPMQVVAVKAEPVVVAEPVEVKRVKRAVQREEAVVVRLETADPDVVIYWTFESGGGE